MANPTIIEYIKKQAEAGFSEIQVREALSKAGWFENEINDAFSSIKESQPSAATLPVEKPVDVKPEIKPEPPKEEKPSPKEPKPEQKKFEPLIKSDKIQPKSEKSGPGILTLLPMIFSIIGGALFLVNSILYYLEMGDILNFIIEGFQFSFLTDIGLVTSGDIPIIGIVLGIGLLINAFLIKIGPEISRTTSILMVVLAVVGMLIGNGYLIGSVISLIGGALGIIKR